MGLSICRNASLFSFTVAERIHVRRRALFQQYRDASCLQVFTAMQKAKEFHAILTEILGEKPPLYSTFKNWVAQFKHVDYSTSVAPRSGRSKRVTTHEIIIQIHKIIFNNITYSTSRHLSALILIISCIEH